jgi:branched-chain amino acid transport system permease protein
MARFEGRTRSALLAVLCVAFLAIAPRFIGLFAMSTVSDIFMVATIAFALNLIAGYDGCPAFGNVVFFGIGAYATGLVMVRYDGPFALGLAVAAAACAVTALLAGPPLLRLRGHYFAIGTLGLNGAAAQLVTNLTISGGARGLSLPLAAGTPHAVATFFYEAFLATLVVAVVAGYALTRGPLGYDLKAIRSGDDVAGSLGVDTLGVKVRVWVVSAIFTGIAGGVYAYSLTYIEPPDVFSLALSVKAFVINDRPAAPALHPAGAQGGPAPLSAVVGHRAGGRARHRARRALPDPQEHGGDLLAIRAASPARGVPRP